MNRTNNYRMVEAGGGSWRVLALRRGTATRAYSEASARRIMLAAQRLDDEAALANCEANIQGEA